MAYIFQSIFASEFKNFLIMIRDAGQQTRGYEATFKSLDAFLSEIPGQEKALFIQLGAAYKEMAAQAGQESRDEAFARKQKLDRALNMGQKLVAQGKFSEAEEAFREAVSYYRDEHRLFQMIAKCFIDADQPRRAIDYLRKALEIEPDNEPARLMLEEASSSGN